MSIPHIVSAGVLIQSLDRYLLCHSTCYSNKETGRRWGIPKGEVDQGEQPYATSIREVLEETGLNLVSLGVIPDKKIFAEGDLSTPVYTKHLIVFKAIDEEGILQKESLYCHSNITGTDVPEVDRFGWYTKEEARRIVYPSQQFLFK
jgi:predicted NUDIX family NTP pyrophosphohydrolase